MLTTGTYSIYIFILIKFLYTPVNSAPTPDIQQVDSTKISDNYVIQRMKIAKCRAHCLHEFAEYETNQTISNNLHMCWDFCEMLYIKPVMWRHMCNDPNVCFPGCKTSCAFVESPIKQRKILNGIENNNYQISTFQIQIELKDKNDDDEKLTCINWPLVSQPNHQPIIYIVLKQSDSKVEEIEQSITNQTCYSEMISTSLIKYKVIAVDQHVMIAQDSGNIITRKLIPELANEINFPPSKLIGDNIQITGTYLSSESTISNITPPSKRSLRVPSLTRNNRSFQKSGILNDILTLKKGIILATVVIVLLTCSMLAVTLFVWLLLRRSHHDTLPILVEDGKPSSSDNDDYGINSIHKMASMTNITRGTITSLALDTSSFKGRVATSTRWYAYYIIDRVLTCLDSYLIKLRGGPKDDDDDGSDTKLSPRHRRYGMAREIFV